MTEHRPNEATSHTETSANVAELRREGEPRTMLIAEEVLRRLADQAEAAGAEDVARQLRVLLPPPDTLHAALMYVADEHDVSVELRGKLAMVAAAFGGDQVNTAARIARAVRGRPPVAYQDTRAPAGTSGFTDDLPPVGGSGR